MSSNLPLLIESLVSILLLLTIGYCILLNKRLKRLKRWTDAYGTVRFTGRCGSPIPFRWR